MKRDPDILALVLDLCGGSGAWSAPYRDAGYDVRVVDVLAGQDVRLFPFPHAVHGILAAPPCTHLAASGARWWKGKGKGALLDALSISDACLRLVALCNPAWWAMENPVGRLRQFYGPPTMTFDPCDFGDPYTKRTLLWGRFNLPIKNPVAPEAGSKMWRMSPGPERATNRSITPAGFAQAFFEANP